MIDIIVMLLFAAGVAAYMFPKQQLHLSLFSQQ